MTARCDSVVESHADHFLITGAGRCGTHWWQAALQELGVATGHEAVYAPWGRVADRGPRRRLRLRGDWGRFRGDSSWPAVAYLEHAVDRRTRVVHSVRDPLAMVRSRFGDNKLADDARSRVVRDCVFTALPEIRDDAADDLGRAILFVARWNRWCASELQRLGFHHRRVRIEDVSTDPGRFVDVVELLTGDRPAPAAARHALEALGPDIGRHRPADLGWDTVRAHPNGAELVSLAAEYGYPTA